MKSTSKRVLLILAISLIVVGAVMGALWGTIFDNILKSQLELTNDSTTFKLWKETPIPMYIEFYMYNVTNSEEVRNNKAKPILIELGPYVFSEEHSKTNITWNKNQSITFNQVRRWHYLPDKSIGSLDDKITNLNTMSLVVASMSHQFPESMIKFLNIFLNKEGSLFNTKTVRELLFEGYDDKVIYWLKRLEVFTHIHIPFDKFGWFYMRNNSWSYDGVFNMFTGTGQVEHLGKMHSWNYYTRVPYYDGHCADVNGTAGELWPPNETGNEVTMFVSDLCRSITLNYEEEQSVFGVVGRKFIGRRSVVANATDNADNKCFTRGKIYPSGVFDVSGCKFGAPAYMSFPNFYLADPFYLDNVVGLKPEKDKHEFQITLEPRTGIPLSVSGRLQLNLHLQPVKGITMYESVPDVFMPMLWFTERAAVTPDLADEVKLLLIVPTAGQGIFFGLLGLGVFLVLVHVLMTLRGNWKAGEANAQLVVTS
ncbi:protein croquemort-like isoform X1 [Ischnura elegans]|uniref:protein croquemort-like isoform X1 n=1 Tax=Ischnura elegans TaxID=197161 RepID=UPI001ED88570|nr:protein croquemort-like isoform X1 [Ischnura elegans]XP_046389201.1 protein croquemort-like isoform X1 [Ischnura elegans]XP_046389202.1 protein croquemort-like isoform X1 [Ischnura elegans]XP_046389203.1 protein croquemort-like isoform X1 [Ischnura elegans]XP_046389204.1 protein croquemort-like isoform X1 [Ischnura elegans]XP_046389205.1 protein croquemort-like isoform X1 [Ischnura elegans]